MLSGGGNAGYPKITLADHIDFCVERYRKNLRVRMPLYYDFEQLYPVEYKISRYILGMVNRRFRVRLPKDEIVGIGMNIMNAELELKEGIVDDSLEVMTETFTRIIEEEFNIDIDRETGSYARYVSHMHYLIQRVSCGEQENNRICFREECYR